MVAKPGSCLSPCSHGGAIRLPRDIVRAQAPSSAARHALRAARSTPAAWGSHRPAFQQPSAASSTLVMRDDRSRGLRKAARTRNPGDENDMQ
jgi:hypothetical protein